MPTKRYREHVSGTTAVAIFVPLGCVVLAAAIGEALWRNHRESGRSDEAGQSVREAFKQLSIYNKWLISLQASSLSQEEKKSGSELGMNAFSSIDAALQVVDELEVVHALERVKDESWAITTAIMQSKELPDLGSLQTGRSELKRIVETRMRIKV
jgi:hypothetical protein